MQTPPFQVSPGEIQDTQTKPNAATAPSRATLFHTVSLRIDTRIRLAATPAAAVERAVTLEEVARLALLTRLVNPDAGPLDDVLRDKHHERKHGPNAYYGQR